MKTESRQIGNGVRLTAVQTNKFKTSLLAVQFLVPLQKETAAKNALIPAILRRGTQQCPDMQSLSAALDEMYGATVEPILRKKGETQAVGFLGSFLDAAYIPGQSNMLKDAAELMASLLLRPAGSGFVEEYLESEKQNLLLRLRGRINNKQQYALYRLVSQMCAEEAYGIDRLGEESQVAAVTGEALWQQYQTLLKTAPMEIYYCGTASIEQVEKAIKEAFRSLLGGERAALPRCNAAAKSPQDTPRYFEDRLDVTQGKLSLGFRLGGGYTESCDLAPLLVLNALFGGSTNSKLFMNVREKLSLCYYASSMAERFKGLLFVNSGVAFDKYEQAKDEILTQLDDCRDGKITAEELDSARCYVAARQKAGVDAQDSLEDFWLGQAIAGETFSPDDLVKQVEKVSLEQVTAVAKSLTLDSIYFLRGQED